MMKANSISAGLTFMLAAANGMPRSLGDRERIVAMNAAMNLAVSARFAFDAEDKTKLYRMGIERCVGVFRPLDENFYRRACYVGGTYPRMWEKAHNTKPWRAAKAVFRGEHRYEVLENARVCPHIGVLLPASFTEDAPNLASYEGLQVWWVTSFEAKTITLCRYTLGDGYQPEFRHPGGAPARRRKLTREAWDAVQAQLAALVEPTALAA